MTTPSIRARAQGALRNAGLSGEGSARACCSPIWGRSPRRNCRSGSRSPGRTAFAEIVISEIPCNWFQCQENSCDPVHFEWMHENWSTRLRGATGPMRPKHLKLKFEEFDYGFIYKRIREGAEESDANWTIGRVALWPNGFYLGDHFEWRVPIDDENTLSVCWFFTRVPKEKRTLRAGQDPDLARARSRTSAATGSRATSSIRTSSPGSGRASSPIAPRKRSVPAISALR